MRRVIVVAALCAVGCGMLSGLDGLERATCEGACDDASTFDGSSSDGTTDAGGDAANDAAIGDGGTTDSGRDSATVSCAFADAGPSMVLAGASCIDSTEVTNLQYETFVADATKPAAPASCAWNADYKPQVSWPVGAALKSFPVTHVDWCDAYVYCAWAGKRLCGHAGGGAIDPSQTSDAAASEWFSSCSAGGTRKFPYGAAFQSAACNGLSAGLDASAAVGSFAGCVGGYAGIHDMSGNVLEWADSCGDAGTTLQADPCAAYGGDYSDGVDNGACASNDPHLRDTHQRNLGFRCCATPR